VGGAGHFPTALVGKLKLHPEPPEGFGLGRIGIPGEYLICHATAAILITGGGLCAEKTDPEIVRQSAAATNSFICFFMIHFTFADRLIVILVGLELASPSLVQRPISSPFASIMLLQ
jgi:hypothetical protein